MNLELAWFGGSLILFFIWLIIYYSRSDLRREMLWVSFIFLPLGLTGHLYAGSYWQPEHVVQLFSLNIGIADFLYTFSVSGIGAVSYQFFFDKHYTDKPGDIKWYRVLSLLLISSIGVGVFLILQYFLLLDLNIIWTSGIGLMVISLILAFVYPKQVNSIIINGLVFGVVIVLVEILVSILFPGFFDLWIDEKLIGTFLLGVPLEEFLWHFAWGAAIGAMFEISRGIRDE